MNRNSSLKKNNSLIRNRSVVFWIICINVAVFLFLRIYLAITTTPETIESPPILNFFALKATNILAGKYLITLITHMFTHITAIHLFINMFALFSLGSLAQKIIGRKRFLWFYLAAGLFAGILSVLLAGFLGTSKWGGIVFGTPDIFMVGASGAIFGIAGLYSVLLPRLRFSIIFLPFFTIPGYIMIPAVLFGFWIITIIAGFFGTLIPLGNVAHFGGYLAGVIYGMYLKTKYKKKVDRLQKLFR